MKKLLPILIILIGMGAGGAVFYAKRGDKEPTVTTLALSRGTIVDGVRATGTLQAVTSVTVGAQVSGIVQDLDADFNDIVKKGQVIARLDPSILQTQLETAKANLVNAEANLERQKVSLQDAQVKLKRAQELDAKQLTTRVDLENAEVAVKQADAQLKSTESQIVQAKAAVSKANVDLDHTIITAPIDGIVIKRSVDRGQTVNAGMQAPELFIIAADLTKMQVNANIDETDVGRMRPGQDVNFTVDAYPTENFRGTVKQVRLNPTTVQNVVTYSTVIDVPNPELKLKPGMTANVTIQIARRDNVLRIPNAAIRFRPTKDMFDALHQAIPPELERGFGGRGRSYGGGSGGRFNADNGAPSGGPAAATPGAGTAAPQARANQTSGTSGSRQGAADPRGVSRQGQPQSAGQGGGFPGGGRFADMTPEERQKAMAERMRNMTPEERAQFEERRKQREANGGGTFPGGPGGAGRGGNAAGARGGRASAPEPARSAAVQSATTIDALFGPLPPVETRGRVWLYMNKQLKPVDLRLGISDGTYTEVLNDAAGLEPSTEVVTALVTAEMATTRPAGASNQNGNPLLPPQRGRGPGR